MSRDNKGRLVVALIFVTFLMSACSVIAPSTRPDIVKAHRNTIVFSALSPNASYWEQRIAAFEAANPTVHVELRYERVTDDWAGHADIVLGPWPDVWPKAISKSSLLDLTPLIEDDPTFDTADFYPGALDLYRQDGHTWAIPIGWSFKAVAYLPTTFQEKGVPLPTLTWTWADVIEAARRLSDGPLGYPCSFATSTDLIIAAPNWLTEKAGSPYLQQGGLIVPALNSPGLRRALADYKLLAQELTVLYDDGSVRSPAEILDAIVQGRAGMSIVEISSVTDFQQRFPQIALAPLPPGEVAASEAQQAAAVLFINAGTFYPVESWRWLRFVSQQDLSPFLGSALPTRRSIAEASDLWPRMSPVQVAVIRATITNHADRPRLTGSAGILATYQALWRAIWDVQYGGQDVDTALDHAQTVALAAQQAAREQNAAPESPPMVRTPVPSGGPVIEFQAMWNPEIYRQAAVLYAADDATVPIQVGVIESGHRADCMEFVTLGSALETAQLTKSLETLGPWLEATSDLTLSAFFPDALAAVSWQDELYGIPIAVKPPTLRFRPELFRALDLDLPSRRWTIEEVIQTAQEIEDGGHGYFGLLPQPEEMAFLLDQLGVPLFTSEPPIRPRFVASDVAATVARLARLGDEKVVVPASLEDALMLISSGRVAMWLDGITLLNPSVYGAADVVALQLRPETPFPMQTTFLGILKGTSQTQSCWAWITYLVRQGIHPPDGLSALRQQAASEAARPGPQQAVYAAALAALQQARSVQAVRSPATEGAVWWFTQALREIGRGSDLAQALQTAQDKAEAFLACLGPAGENDLDRAAKCARQVDPAHPLAQLSP